MQAEYRARTFGEPIVGHKSFQDGAEWQEEYVRVSEEPNIEQLRRKAGVLEAENERLSIKVSQLLRGNLALNISATPPS